MISIFCSDCGSEETLFGFLGHITVECLPVVKHMLLLRGIGDEVEAFIARSATAIKMPCSICKKEVYSLAEHRETFARPEKMQMLEKSGQVRR